MKKLIKKIGNSVGVTFSKEEQTTHNLTIGDTLDLSDIIIKKKTK